MGGLAEQVSGYLDDHYADGLDLVAALQVAVRALGHDDVAPRTLTVDRLEVAVLDRTRTQPRKFRRISGDRLASLFALTMPVEPESPASDPGADAAEGAPDSAVDAAQDGGLDDDALADLPPDPDPPRGPDA